MSMKEITIDRLFQEQYRPYANYDNERSLPNLIDGLKITQRKVLYTCLLKNTTSEMKVAQLASSVAFETHYHHGEAGIGGVICNLAQDFVGSNNLNWLEPIGQFGSRLSPIPAAHRYIFTKLSKNFRQYFRKEDDIILEHLYEDDFKIEPKFFIPILPGILLNSSQGIGTGFASNILARNPKQLVAYINDQLAKVDNSHTILPYFDGFKGTVEQSELDDNKYIIKGCITRVDSTKVKIVELPVGMYLDDIKKQLNKLVECDYIKDYDDNSTEDAFDIDVYFTRGYLSTVDDATLLDKLKLVSTVTENLTCWLPTGKLRKFSSVYEILDYFIQWRLQQYSTRINVLIDMLGNNITSLNEKVRFITFYLNNVSEFKNSSKLELLSLLTENNFSDTMLDMKIWNLTGDKIAELENAVKDLISKKKVLEKTTNINLYIKELETL
jgi:DNA topoisomerase-2